MPRKIHEKFRARSGFTLSEVLVTLAILGVLLAVAIPATVSMAKGLKMMELDSCARQIAVVAQNNLVGVKSAGQLQLLSVGQPPSGGAPSVRRLSKGEPGAEKLLPTGAIDPAVADKYYTIVYNSVTGTVLEVYYAEHSFTVSEALSGMTSDKVEARKAAKIGYYNGADIDSAPIGTLPKPMLIVENGLDLKVTVTTPINWSDKATLTLHVASAKDVSAVKEFKLTVDALGKADVILDSLTNPEKQFQKLFEFGKVIAPGENLKIWATLDPKDPTKYLSATSNIEYTNSLFGTYDLEKKAVTIENARHLQNLDMDFSGLIFNNTLKHYSAVQTQSIDWTKDAQVAGKVGSFAPINNGELTGYNGGTNLISGLNVTAGKSGAGLFGSLKGQSNNKIALTGIRLVNPSVVSTGGTMDKGAGALVGAAENVEVTDCFAYVEKVNGKWPVAQISGGTAGGLIGSAKDCNVSYSGAAMPIVEGVDSGGNSTTAGGLIGEATNTTVTNSYAATDNLGAGGYIAGFIGKAAATDVKNCYAVGNITQMPTGTNAKKASGFISGYDAATVSVSNSYCAMTYLDKKGTQLATDGVWGFGPTSESNSYTYTSCAYLAVKGQTLKGTVPKISYADLAAREPSPDGWTKLEAAHSHPYRDNLKGKAYPFPALKQADGVAKMPHYGSWPAAPDGYLAYCETYANGANGVYYLEKGKNVISTLVGNEQAITGTQYGILLPKGQKTETTNITVGPSNVALKGGFKEKISPTEEWDFYPFNDDSISHINDNRDIVATAMSIDDRPYLINTFFAAAIAASDELPGTESLPFQIRTQEQLKAVNSITRNQHDCYFLQTHNIPMNSSWSPIDFREIYDGNQQKISGLFKPLFATVQSGSTVKNVVIEQAQVAANHGDGIFAKVNSGTIQNSHVHPDKDKKPSTISAKNGDVAGFVGTNSGKITLCSAVANVTSTKDNAAGFVGQNSGTIQKSYANCAVYGGASASGFVNVNQGTIKGCYAIGSAIATGGTAAGFAMKSGGWVTDFQGCYAAVIVNGSPANSFGTGYVNSWSVCYYYPPDGTLAIDAKKDIDASNAKRVTSYANATGNSLLNNLIRASGSGIWTNTGPAHPFDTALGKTIPFPSIIGNEHYGDWPSDPDAPKPTQPIPKDNCMGVFYYKKNDNGTYSIDAAALEYEYKKGKISIKGTTIPDFLKGNFTASDTTLPEPGYGIFYPKDESFYENMKYAAPDDEVEINTLSTDNTFNVNGYFFLPIPEPLPDEGEVKLIYKKGNTEWEYEFKYNTTKNTWTIE